MLSTLDNIKKWFLTDQRMGEDDSCSNFNQLVDQLLLLYYKGLLLYFGKIEAENGSHFIDTVKSLDLSDSDKAFVKWLEDKGFVIIQAVLSANLQDEDSLLSMIEYDRFTLEEELNNYQSLSDVRSCLIAVGNEMESWLSGNSKILEKYIFYDMHQEHEPYTILESALDADSFYHC